MQPQNNIPVRTLAKEFANGIAISKVTSEIFRSDIEVEQSHRHDYHFFCITGKGCFTY